jgi:hypothetical protein
MMINFFYGVGIIWMLIITIVVFRMIRHYNRLTGGNNKRVLKEVLDEMLDKQNKLTSDTIGIKHEITKLTQEGALHIQKVGIERFNPFSDTGGSQSFTLALLDGHKNGIVMTSLYARTGNRWYVKEVQEGKGRKYDLSKEEERAIHNAQSL